MTKIPVSKAYAKWMAEDAERLNAMAELARKVAVKLPTPEEAEERAFCPTGEGGGVDNSCSSVSVNDPSLTERVPFKPAGGKNSDFIRVPTIDELTEALTGSNSAKGTKIGSAKDVPAGTPVALRIDIPAFNYSTTKMGKAIYAVTVHEDKGGKGFGSPIGYEPVARLSGSVTFASKEGSAIKVATGESAKFPLATVKGKFDPSRVMPPDIDSWTPVGYDPKKAAYFYDKRTGREVTGGTDAVSVGNTVFTRNPKYGKRNAKKHYRSLAEMYAVGFWGVEGRAFCPNGEGNGVTNDCPPGGSASSSPKSTPASSKMPRGKVGDPASSTSWLSPDGTFFPVPRATPPAFRPKVPRGFMTHDEWASLHGHEDGEDGLLKAGWARVAKSGNDIYAQTVGGSLTPRQKKSLEDQSLMTDVDSVVHDSAPSMAERGGKENKYKTIWSKSDRAWREDAEARADDCGRVEGGRFGPDNDCQEGAGTATEPFGAYSGTNSKVDWDSDSKETPPFDGADKFTYVSVSSPKRVGETLDKTGMTPSQAVEAVGAGGGGSTAIIRPGPELASSPPFDGSDVTPVFMTFDKPFGGVESALSSASAVGVTRDGKPAVYHILAEVTSPRIAKDPSSRHAVAREFYRTMVESVQASRRNGVSVVALSAAGSARAPKSEGGSAAWRGYTIWPRMGFDGPLPKRVVAKLPESLSHCRTLMDLHATREGTKWWAQNGEDIDVQLDLSDRGSPQNKVFDRFIKHFGTSRRDLPTGEGDDWLSPEDLARLEEMWSEIWDDADILDDYDGAEQKFVVEERAFCATGEGGGQDNSCPPASAGGSSGLTNLGGRTEEWGRNNETEIWTPGRPMFRGADKIGEIMINRPADVRAVAGDALKLTMPEIVTASGALIDAIERAGTSQVRMTITPGGDNVSGLTISWKAVGRATGDGYSGPDKAFAPRPGSVVDAVAASRQIATDADGKVHLYQDAYFIHPDYQGKGLALESVIRQTSVAGIDVITMDASRWDHQNPNQRMNGFWRWPLYGYNASINAVARESKSGEIPREFAKARSLLDIYATPGGMDWWRSEGEDIVLTFDPRPRSQSRLVLLQLQDAVRRKHGSRSIDMTLDDKNLVSTDCDNDPDVLAAWESIIEKGLKQEAPGRLEELEESAQKFLTERAKDGRPPEVFPH